MAGTLQNYNNELVKCIEDLWEKREEINRKILHDEEEKAKIQRDLSVECSVRHPGKGIYTRPIRSVIFPRSRQLINLLFLQPGY